MTEEVKIEESKWIRFWKKVGNLFKALWNNVIKPSLSDMFYRSGDAVLRSVCYQAPITNPPPQPYSRQPTANISVVQRQLVRLSTQRNCFGVYQLVADDRSALERIFAKMQARLNDPASGGTVSVGEMYTYANIPARAENMREGWINLVGCVIRFDPSVNGYTLEMPEQVGL